MPKSIWKGCLKNMEKAERDARILQMFNGRKKKERNKQKPLSPDLRKHKIKQWVTFYRRNIEIYIEERLRIPLKPFQRIMLHLMGVSQQFYAICSRALGKTFTVALFAVAKCMLYPYTEVVITASTLPQGGKMVRDKIQGEIIGKWSPILKFLYDKGEIKINYGKDDISVKFLWNHSEIRVMPPLDSSRGARATMLIYEECRLLHKSDIDSIFEPMLHPRQPEYFKHEEYETDPLLLEDGISIYITSARYKVEWFWNEFKNTVNKCYTSRVVPYNFFAGDVYIALKYGLKTMRDWIKQRQSLSELNLRMEYLNEMIGETADAYFTFELFRRCQVLHKAFRPPTISEFNSGITLDNPPKKEKEYRMIVIDLASADTVKGGEANDNTVVMCLSGTYHKGRITRRLDYLETISGGQSNTTVRRIHELFWDYQADYIVYDARTIGELYYNLLTEQYKHIERDPSRWDSSGFTISTDDTLQVLPDNKLDNLRQRTIDPKAIPCMIPVQGSAEFNSVMWQTLKRTMSDGELKLLIDELDYRTEVDAKKWYLKMDNEQRMLLMLPFVQTALLINEGINLSPEWREGKLKLKESRSGTKDRMVTLAYGNYIFSLLETKLSKADQSGDFTEDDWRNIFIS